MKKLGFLLLFAVLFTTVSVAQDRGAGNFDPKVMAQRQTDELTKELSLKKDQQEKVLALNLKNAEEMAALRDEAMNGDGDRDAMREKMTKLREEQETKMKEILTDAQYKKYQKYLEERRGMRGQRGPRQQQ